MVEPSTMHSHDLQVCPHPVFIIGAPRSGTSILAWSLHHHSAFWTSHETEFLQRIFADGQSRAAFEFGTTRPETWLCHHDVSLGEFMSFLGLGVNALMTSRSGGRRWIDQTPSYTLFAEELASLFPGAQFIHIIRDGRLVVRSMTHFAKGIGRSLDHAELLPEWSRGFEVATSEWVRYCETATEFCTRYPHRTLAIRNEELTADPMGSFDRLLCFLGEDPEPGPGNFFMTSRINSSFETLMWGSAETPPTKAVMPTSAAGADVWRGWTAEERGIFADVAGNMLVELGYASRSDLE